MFEATLKTILDEILLLQLLLPLAGAVLAAALAFVGPEFAHRAALSNATLTCVLSGVMLGLFGTGVSDRAESFGLQFHSNHRWTGIRAPSAELPDDERQDWPDLPEVRLQLAVDGVSIWMVSMSHWLVLAILFIIPAHEPVTGRLSCFLLLCEAAATGTYCSTNLISFCVFAEGLLLGGLLLLSQQRGYERLRAAYVFVSLNLLAGAVLLIAFSGIGLARSAEASVRRDRPDVVFDLEVVATWASLLDGSRGVKQDLPAWDRLRGAVFVLLLLGFLVKAAIVPFQSWYLRFGRAASPAIHTWFAAVATPLGWYGLYRFVLPVLPVSFAETAWLLLLLGSVGVVASGLQLATEARRAAGPAQLTTLAGVHHSCLFLVGLGTLNAEGIMGAVLLSLSYGVSGFVVLLTDSSPSTHVTAVMVRQRWAHILGRLALLGCPGSLGFAGRVLILLGLVGTPVAGTPVEFPGAEFSLPTTVLACVLTGMVLAAFGLFPSPQRAVLRAPRPGWESPVQRLTASPTVLLVQAALIVGLGLFPSVVATRARPSVNAMLTHVDFVISATQSATAARPDRSDGLASRETQHE